MRIAFSGAHCTGKSTLLAAVAERLPGHDCVDEPYYLLDENEDFDAQLACSLEALADAGPDTLFDRCPADLLAYLESGWTDEAREAVESLDLIVFVPIEAPDRIAVPAHEDRAWRAQIDAALDDLLAHCDVEVLRVEGTLAERVEQVLSASCRDPRTRGRS